MWPEFWIVTTGYFWYRKNMRLGPKYIRCSKLGLSHFRTFAARGNHSGFSLLELLIVIALVLILTTMYWGGNAGKSKQKALKAACQQNLQKIHLAMEVYANDQGSRFPATTNATTSEQPLDLLVPRYNSDTAVFTCPGSKDKPVPAGDSLVKHKISYAYYQGRRSAEANEVLITDHQVDTQSKSIGQAVFSISGAAPGNNHGKAGGNFLFCDGHVESGGPNTPFSLVLTQSVVLLNPKP
jgi:prepilin-type N-terminal cleavage/methylation domain-containing protein/prepilin-type processing-associated H-X9-DG protein